MKTSWKSSMLSCMEARAALVLGYCHHWHVRRPVARSGMTAPSRMQRGPARECLMQGEDCSILRLAKRLAIAHVDYG
jgi:hypothetical protein